jgi:hypothetical protein
VTLLSPEDAQVPPGSIDVDFEEPATPEPQTFKK